MKYVSNRKITVLNYVYKIIFCFVLEDECDADQPLYSGATITLAASMILLISFAMRHSLTGEAISDLLVLLELHCLTPNLCRTNLKTFMDFFRNFKSPLEFHHYCEHCFLYSRTEKFEVCPNCNQTSKKTSAAYFLVIPLASQLSSLFAGIQFIHCLNFFFLKLFILFSQFSN